MIYQGLVLYFLLTFGIGLFSLGFVCVAYIKIRNTILKYYLYYDVTFTLYIAIWMFFYYLSANLSSIDIDPQHSLLIWLDYTQAILLLLLLFTMPLFLHEFFASSHCRLRNRIIGLIVVGDYLMMHGNLAVFIVSGKMNFLLSLFEDVILFGVLLYCFILSLFHYRRSSQFRYIRLISLIFGASVVLQFEYNLFMLLSLYFEYPLPIRNTPLFPIMYAASNIIFGIYFGGEYWLKHHHQTAINHTLGALLSATALGPSQEICPINEHQPHSTGIETQSFDDFCEQRQLSAREREVLLLLLSGQTNTQIAEQLFISANTVKTHIGNIYQKVGVNRRYELLAHCKHLSMQSNL